MKDLKIIKRNRFHRIISFFLVAIILISSSLQGSSAENNTDGLPTPPALGNSGGILGASSLGTDLSIYNQVELIAFGATVNQGVDYTGKVISLEADVHLGESSLWEPIGTKEHPFTGTFDGKEHKIFGIGGGEETLFGYLKGATIKNLILYSYHSDATTGGLGGLFLSMENSTIVNCQIFPLMGPPSVRSMLASRLTPDASWFDFSSQQTEYTLTSERQLLGIAEIINRNVNPFAFEGVKINLSKGLFDLSAVANWQPIGSKDRPFKGSILGLTSGTTIKSLTINLPSQDDIGFVGYIEGGNLENLAIVDATVVGLDNVGALVGRTGVNGALPNTVGDGVTFIKDCSSSGDVSGRMNIGGLIGFTLNTDATPASSTSHSGDAYGFSNGETGIVSCYSTANVVGIQSAGGLLGKGVGNDSAVIYPTPSQPNGVYCHYIIKDCFATGRVAAITTAGGLIGSMEGAAALRCAASGQVSAVGKAAGILGKLDNPDYNFVTTLVSCYSSSAVHGSSDTGGLIGLGAGFMDSYTSGDVSAPSVFSNNSLGSGTYVSPFVGYPMWDNFPENLYADPNTVYMIDTPKNHGVPLDDPESRFRDYESEFIGHTVPWIWFDDDGIVNTVATNGDFKEFRFDSLTYTGDYITNDPVRTPESGAFPALFSFELVPNSPFDIFSKITTRAAYKSIPTELKFAAGSASKAGETTAFVFPALPDGMEWRINGKNSITIVDPTLGDGVTPVDNHISIKQNADSSATLAMDFPLKQKEEITISAYSTTISDLEIKYSITLLDDTIRALPTSSFLNMAGTNLQDAKTNDIYLSLENNTVYLEFDEIVDGYDATTSSTLPTFDINLYKYSDGNFTSETTTTATASVRVLGQKTIEITLPTSAMQYGESWRLEFSSQNGTMQTLIDNNGEKSNTYEENFYLKLRPNEMLSFSFNEFHPIVMDADAGSETISTKNPNDTQIIYMEENASSYSNMDAYLHGIEQSNESLVDLSTPGFATLHTKSIAPLPGYPSKDNTNLLNFYHYAGEHVITYTMDDPENPTEKSEPITRTFRIHSPAVVEQNGKALGEINNLTLSRENIERISKEIGSSDPKTIVNEALEARYFRENSPERITASYYDYTGKIVYRKITADTSAVDMNSFMNGFKQAISFQVEDGPTLYGVLIMEGILPDVQILVDEAAGYIYATSDREITRGDIRKYFNAKVVKRSNPTVPVNTSLNYDIRGLDRTKHTIPQEIKIYLPEYQDSDFDEIKKFTEVIVHVVFEEKLAYKHPEDKEDVIRIYWDDLLNMIRKSAKGKNHQHDIYYEPGTAAPPDLFRIIANQEGSLLFNYPSGITMHIQSDDIDKSKIPTTYTSYNLNIEPAYHMHIIRDAGGSALQQFRTSEETTLPTNVTISIPLEESLPTKNLILYRLDENTNRYEKIRKLTNNEMTNGVLTYETNQLQGIYIITAADLDGKDSTVPTAEFKRDPIRVLAGSK